MIPIDVYSLSNILKKKEDFQQAFLAAGALSGSLSDWLVLHSSMLVIFYNDSLTIFNIGKKKKSV